MNCFTAYTCNGFQPVVCSLIGEEPLYYLDDDVDDYLVPCLGVHAIWDVEE